MKSLCVIAVLSLLVTLSSVLGADNMKAFPPAEKGMVRHVLNLPAQDDESAFKVELIVGKTVQLAEGNHYFFGGQLEAETIEGWGYTRYVLKQLGPMGGTLMAVDPDAPKVNRFIPIGGDPYLIRYNSRLPIVIYVPAGVEVRHRIWSAPPTSTPTPKG